MVFGIKKYQDEIFCLTEERDYFQSKYTEQVSIIGALQEDLKSSKREIVRLRRELMIQVGTPGKESPAQNSNSNSNSNSSNASKSHDKSKGNNSSPAPVDQVSTLTTDDTTSTLASPTSFGRSNKRGNGLRISSPAAKEAAMVGIPPETTIVRSQDSQDEYDLDDASSCLTEDSHGDEDEDEKDDEDEDTEAQDIRQSAEKLLQWASYRTTHRTSDVVVGSSPSLQHHSNHDTDNMTSPTVDQFHEEKKESETNDENMPEHKPYLPQETKNLAQTFDQVA